MILKIAMIFPGQGSQNIQNLYKLYNKSTTIQNTFEEASHYLNYNIIKNIKKRNIFQKNQYIQPLILTYSVAIYRLWKKLGGLDPHITAGHSLGEYSALVCGEIIKFSDAIQLVAQRGKIMEKYIKNKKTSMKAIIGLDKHTVYKICNNYSYNNIVNIASINSHDQIIISGYTNAVHNACIKCKKYGAKQILNIPIYVAAHCKIMKKLARKLIKKIKKIPITNSKYPIINSISVQEQKSKHTIRKYLIQQLYKPVRWYETIKIIQSQSDIILELGMNKILINMIKKKNNLQLIAMNKLKNIYLALNKISNIQYEK